MENKADPEERGVSYCRAELSTGSNTLFHPSQSDLLRTFVNLGDALFVRKSPFEYLQ